MNELIRVCAGLAADAWVPGVALCLTVVGLLLVEARFAPRLSPRAAGWSHRLLLAAALGTGLAFAWQVLWLCDDAFISFRYARNFAEGHGLVFNEGEWVEGYTNFLWTFLLGWIGRLGFDIPLAGLVGNLLCFALALAAVAAAVRRAAPGSAAIPFAALALAASRPFHTFASSGLETMPAAMLLAGAILATTWRRGAALAGVALTGAVLMRPDMALLYGCMGLALAGEDLIWRKDRPLLRRVDFSRLAVCAASFVIIYIPYFLWRWQAYGELLPNTWYAKSGGSSYYEQGLIYLVHFLGTSGAWLWLPLLAATAFLPHRSRDETRLRLFALLAVPIFGHYVVKVGGDFMEHRFFVPLLPIAAISLEVSLRSHLRSSGAAGRLAWGGAAAAAIAVACVPIRPIAAWEKKWHLADESSFYRVLSISPLEVSGSRLGQVLGSVFTDRGLSPRIADGAIGLLGYHSRLPIVDMLGLVTPRIAHKSVNVRGRPGHEKIGEIDDVLAEGATISIDDHWGKRWRRFTAARVDGLDFYVLRWDPALIAALRSVPRSRLPDPRREIQALLRTETRAGTVDALAFLQRYLADHPERAQLLSMVEDRLRSVSDFEGSLPEGARVEGRGLRIERSGVPGGVARSGWLASLPDRDGGTGVVELPLGHLPDGELRFALGGSASEQVYAELVVEGEVVHRATASGTGALQPHSWDVAAHAGKAGILRFVDADASAGVGLLADAIHWSHPTSDIRHRIRDGRGVALLEAAAEVLPAEDPDLLLLASRFQHRWDFDRPHEGMRIVGEAFGNGPVAGSLHGQTRVDGVRGAGFLNSFHGGDGSVGRVELPAFTISGGSIHVRVGGGRDCDRVYVGLEIDGVVRRRVCGQDDEVLRDALLPTRAFAGQQGRIVVVDDARGGWGHILADSVAVQPAAEEATPAAFEVRRPAESP